MINIAEITKDLQTFIEVITGDINATVTFQTFSEKHSSNVLAEVHHGTVRSLSKRLLALNQKGAGIFMMVNEGDQQGRKAENVTRVRALFADFDGSDHRPALEALPPHLVVESSPGKYHLYWLVDDCPLEEFTPIQKAIASRFGSDISVHDLCRVMRLPGFYHQKSKPFLVHIVKAESIPPYSKDEVVDALGLDLSSQPLARTQQLNPQIVHGSHDGEIVDPATGEMFNLKHWVIECPDFMLADALKAHASGVIIGKPKNGKQHIRCPFHHEHTDQKDDTATFCVNGTASKTEGFVIKCLHNHCAGRDRLDFIQQILAIGWLPLEALSNQQFLAERIRPPWVKYPLDALLRSPSFNTHSSREKVVFKYVEHISLTTGEGTCPADPWLMSRQLGISEQEWTDYQETFIRSGLLREENGRLIHEGTLAIYETSRKAYAKEVRAGRRGGMSKKSPTNSSSTS